MMRVDTIIVFEGKFSVTPLPAKKPRPIGLYGTIPMPSSLHEHLRKNEY